MGEATVYMARASGGKSKSKADQRNVATTESAQAISQQWDRVRALLVHIGSKFRRDGLLESAGLLTYTTLLSLVPLLIVSISIVSSLPGSDDWKVSTQEFVYNYFIPDTGATDAETETIKDTITSKLSALTNRQSGLTVTMTIFLVITSLLMMSTIEGVMNRIWGVHTSRSLVSKIVVYWSMLTMGPVLLGASLAFSSYVFSIGLLSELRSQAEQVPLYGYLLPMFVSALSFYLLYMIIPNRRVNWHHALLGACVTAILFEMAKKGFGIYISNFNAYSLIYDALGAIPVFLLWIYLSWCVVLLGASFTASLESFSYGDPGSKWPEEQQFVLLYRLLGHLWKQQSTGEAMTDDALLKLEPLADDDQVLALLEHLRVADMVQRNEDGDWLLSRDLDEVNLAQLYRTTPLVWPFDLDSLDTSDVWNESLRQVMKANRELNNTLQGISLKSLYTGRHSGEEPGQEL